MKTIAEALEEGAVDLFEHSMNIAEFDELQRNCMVGAALVLKAAGHLPMPSVDPAAQAWIAVRWLEEKATLSESLSGDAMQVKLQHGISALIRIGVRQLCQEYGLADLSTGE